jgi:hypothetical protein
MAKRDAFIEDFKKLLESIPDNYSLPQWQFAYRQVAYSMGMKILGNFASDVVAPDPSGLQPHGPMPAQSPGKSAPVGIAGQTGGGHPTIICSLVCLVLGVTPSGGTPPPGPL